jgi:hypothetical protein
MSANASGTSSSAEALAAQIPAGPYFALTGVGDTLTAAGQTITGSFTFTQSSSGGTTTSTLVIAGASASISAGGNKLLSLTGGHGSLSISSAGIVGSLAATPTLSSSLSSYFQLSSVAIAVNTTSSAADGLPAGPFVSLQATGATITVGTQTLQADLGFQYGKDSGGNALAVVAVANVSTTLAGGTASISDGSGIIVLSSDGNLAAQLSATVALNVPSVTLSGSFSVQLSTNGSALNQTFTLGSQSVVLNVAGAPGTKYIQLAGTGISLTALGQTMTGDVTVASDGTLTFANLVLKLGGTAASPLVTVTGGGSLTISSSGISGTFSVGVAVNNLLGITLPSTGFSLAVNTTHSGGGPYIKVDPTGFDFTLLGVPIHADDIIFQQSTDSSGNEVVTVGVQNGSLSFPGGFSVSAINGVLILSQAGVAGTLSATLSASSSSIAVTGTFSLAVNTGANAVNETIPAGNTSLSVNLPGGPYVSLQATDGVVALNPVSFTATGGTAGQLTLVSGSPAQGQYVVGNGIPAGTSIQTISGNAITLSAPVSPTGTGTLSFLASSYVLTGSIGFQRSGSGGSPVTVVAVSGLSVYGGTSASLTAGQGGLVISSDGIAAIISGTASAGDMTGGVRVTGTVVLRINTGANPVDQTVTLGSQSVEIRFGTGEVATGTPSTPFVALSVGSLSLNIGNFVSIQGSVSFTPVTVSTAGGSVSGQAFAGDGLTIFLGKGPATTDNGSINPLATGILLSNTHIGLIQIGSNYALAATGTATVIGLPAVTLSGTVTVAFNNTGSDINQTIPIPGSTSPGVTVNVADGARTFSLDGGQIGINDPIMVPGNFGFTPIPGGVAVAVTGASLSFSGGEVMFSGGTGILALTTSGLAGSLSGTLSATLANVSFGGTYSLAINTSGSAVSTTVTAGGQTVSLNLPAGPYVEVSGTGATVTVQGQMFTGNFALQIAQLSDGTTAASLAASNVSLTIGTQATTATAVTPLASLTGGQGAFVITSSGLAGQLRPR